VNLFEVNAFLKCLPTQVPLLVTMKTIKFAEKTYCLRILDHEKAVIDEHLDCVLLLQTVDNEQFR